MRSDALTMTLLYDYYGELLTETALLFVSWPVFCFLKIQTADSCRL